MTLRTAPATNRRLAVRTTVRWTGGALATALFVTLTSAAAHLALTNRERAELSGYGQRVRLPSGTVNVYRSGGHGPSLVLLSGLGTPAPAADFAPLIRELGGFDVIVVEGFGYGASDLDVGDRSVENIASELHEALRQVGVRPPVVLAGHSIGGVYARYYAQAYPGEVSALIGIDPTPASASTLEVGWTPPTAGLLAWTGLPRWVLTLAPELILPSGTAYTEDERSRMLTVARWNYGNRSVADEEAHLAASLTRTAARPFPSDIPVLEFLAGDKVASDPSWLPRHQRELAGVRQQEIRIVSGEHYLHWTQAPLLGRSIAAFVAREVPSGRTAR